MTELFLLMRTESFKNLTFFVGNLSLEYMRAIVAMGRSSHNFDNHKIKHMDCNSVISLSHSPHHHCNVVRTHVCGALYNLK